MRPSPAMPCFGVWSWTKRCGKRRRRRGRRRRATGGGRRSPAEGSRGSGAWSGSRGRQGPSTGAATTTRPPARSSPPPILALRTAICRRMSRRSKAASETPPHRRTAPPSRKISEKIRPDLRGPSTRERKRAWEGLGNWLIRTAPGRWRGRAMAVDGVWRVVLSGGGVQRDWG